MLEVHNVVAAYGKKIRALKNISLSVSAGEIVCLIGSNGSGKSSLLHAISGRLPPEAGEIFFEGENLAGWPVHKIAARGVIHVPEGRRIFPKLTVLENLEMGGFTKKRDGAAQRRQLDFVFSIFPVIKERLKQWGGTLSGGEQQMLAIGRALMAEPKLLMLDEPSMGLAPLIVDKIFRILRDINARGTTILIVEQNASEALKLAHRGYVLQTGRIVLEDTAPALLQNADVKKYYLGVH